MKKVISAVFIFIVVLALSQPLFAGEICTLKIEGAITPPTANFIGESVTACNSSGAEAIIFVIDTPGGLDTSMRLIVKTIMESKIPVIVFVHPSGARAASAGAIILLSAHIAAMSPGTNVGAAHPVNIGKDKEDKTMMQKVAKDAEAYAKSIAIKRGRNQEWAAKAVRESSSITAQDALKLQVIDILANDIPELLLLVDGKTVETASGTKILNTKNATLREIKMSFKYRFLSHLSDPNVAYILMMLGMFGILFEIFNPGAMFPGIIGGICIILSLYAFQAIPISYAGLFLIILAIIFFILEIKIVSHGALSIAGIISLVLGSIMLIDDPTRALSISWKSIAFIAVLSGLFFFGVLFYALKAQFSKVRTGGEGLVGESGIAKTDIDPKGTVLVHGELWSASSGERIEKGEAVVVTGMKGLKVTVKKGG